MKKLTIIVPIYFNYNNLDSLYEDLRVKLFSKLLDYDFDYELIMVDDGSKDNSYDKILELKNKDSKIVAVRLSKNFGEHNAILAGLSVSSGDVAVVKTADIQEPTELIIEMLDKYIEGYDSILAVRKDREDTFSTKLFSNTYYKIFRYFSKLDMPDGGFDTFMISRKVIDVLCMLDEKNTTLMGLVLWAGFKTAKVYFNRQKREIGTSMWTLSKKIKLFEDSMYSFSIFPLKFIGTIGICFIIFSIVLSIYFFVQKILNNVSIQGFTTLAIISLVGTGLVLMSLSVIGEYLYRVFDATRNRPTFIISEIKK